MAVHRVGSFYSSSRISDAVVFRSPCTSLSYGDTDWVANFLNAGLENRLAHSHERQILQAAQSDGSTYTGKLTQPLTVMKPDPCTGGLLLHMLQ